MESYALSIVFVPLRVQSLINQEIIPLIPTPFPPTALKNQSSLSPFLSYPNLFSFWSMKDLPSVCVEFTFLPNPPTPPSNNPWKTRGKKVVHKQCSFYWFLIQNYNINVINNYDWTTNNVTKHYTAWPSCLWILWSVSKLVEINRRAPSRSLDNGGGKVRMVAEFKRNLQLGVEGSYLTNDI